ncbi:MAG: hypothetical protein HYS04_13580 [Acidobacteria bacterium]|nr:hypothetical protein [Acidobacteriota bacterium]
MSGPLSRDNAAKDALACHGKLARVSQQERRDCVPRFHPPPSSPNASKSGTVAHSAGRTLVLDQLPAADEPNPYAIEPGFDARLPRLVEIHAVDRGQQVNAIGSDSELNHAPRLDKIFGRKSRAKAPTIK